MIRAKLKRRNVTYAQTRGAADGNGSRGFRGEYEEQADAGYIHGGVLDPMSGGDGDAGTKAVDWFLPLVGLLMVVGIAWGAGFLQGGENVRRQTAPHQHAQSAKERVISECAGLQGARLVECAQEKIQVAEDTARAEQDLTAQQEAAWGSMFGALAGGAALVITGGGTVLLYQQIKLTREAVQDTSEATREMKHANELTTANQRAWLALEARITKIEYSDLFYITAEIIIKNIGQTVANNVLFSGEIGQRADEWFDNGRDNFLRNASFGFIKPSIILPGEKRRFTSKIALSAIGWESKDDDQRMDFAVHFYCRYRLVGDDSTEHATEGTWSIRMVGEDIFDSLGIPYRTDLKAEAVEALGGIVIAT